MKKIKEARRKKRTELQADCDYVYELQEAFCENAQCTYKFDLEYTDHYGTTFLIDIADRITRQEIAHKLREFDNYKLFTIKEILG